MKQSARVVDLVERRSAASAWRPQQSTIRMPEVAPESRVPDDPAPAMRAGIVVVGLFFGVFGVWAALAPVSGAAIAPGTIKVEGNRQSLQHPQGGTVKRILVKDGDRVTRGQTLIQLDDIAARAKAESATVKRDALKALEARLIAERDGAREIAFDPLLTSRANEPAVITAMTNQLALFETRRRQFESEIATLRQKIAQLSEQIAGLKIQAESAERQQELIQEELKGTRELYKKGYSPKTKVLGLERAEAELASVGGARRADIAKTREAIGEAEITILRAQQERLTEITDQLRDTQTKLAEIGPQLEEAQDILEKTDMVAPVSGEVVGMTVFTEGGVIAAGSRVLDIVPSHGNLVIEARVRPEDVHDVSVGAEAEIRLIGMVGRERPAMTGKVVIVSADRLESDRANTSYYAVQVQIDPDSLQKASIVLQAGMPADVLIATKAHTVLQYLISPLTDQIARGFREG